MSSTYFLVDGEQLKPLTKAEQDEARRIFKTYGPEGQKREARKRERQVRMEAFVAKHAIGCFKCGYSHGPWAKTGISWRGPWALCLSCVKKNGGGPRP
jgi:hypothetical protein